MNTYFIHIAIKEYIHNELRRNTIPGIKLINDLHKIHSFILSYRENMNTFSLFITITYHIFVLYIYDMLMLTSKKDKNDQLTDDIEQIKYKLNIVKEDVNMIKSDMNQYFNFDYEIV